MIKHKLLWGLMIIASALNGVQAIFSFEKYPVLAIFMGILSWWMLKQAMGMENIFNSYKGNIMGEKIVAMLSEDDELKAVCSRINQRRQFADKRMEDFQKQMQEKMEALSKENEADWDLVKRWLKNKGRLPADFNDQTHNISFNIKDNGVKVGKNSDMPDIPGLPPGMKVRNMGTFTMEDLPPELKKQMDEFIKGKMKDE